MKRGQWRNYKVVKLLIKTTNARDLASVVKRDSLNPDGKKFGIDAVMSRDTSDIRTGSDRA